MRCSQKLKKHQNPIFWGFKVICAVCLLQYLYSICAYVWNRKSACHHAYQPHAVANVQPIGLGLHTCTGNCAGEYSDTQSAADCKTYRYIGRSRSPHPIPHPSASSMPRAIDKRLRLARSTPLHAPVADFYSTSAISHCRKSLKARMFVRLSGRCAHARMETFSCDSQSPSRRISKSLF